MKYYSIKEIRDFISCPQFGNTKYGRWGALRLEVRETILRLCDLCDSSDSVIKNMTKENELLKEELTNLKNDITRVYNTMISLETINKQEMEEVEEI